MINIIFNLLELDIEKAVEIAKKSNIQILQNQENIKQYRSDYIKARSQIFPQFNINGIYTYTANPAVIRFGAPTKYIGYQNPQNPNEFIIYPDPNSIVYSEIPFRPYNSYNIQFTLRQSIFSWFREFNAMQLAKEQIEVQNQNIELLQYRLSSQIKSFYLDILFFKETFKVYEETIKDLELVYNATKKRFESGLASNLELLQAQVNYENAKFNYENAKKTYNDLLSNLKILLNLPEEEEVVIIDSLEGVKIDTNFIINENKLKLRKDLLLLENQMKILQKLAQIQSTLNKPNIFAQVQYLASRPAPNLEDKWGGTWTFSIIFSWNVFDGFSTNADIQKINNQIDQLKLIYDFQVQTSKIQLQNALNSISIAKNNLENTKRNANLAQELLKTAKIQFENGLISNLQLYDIQRSYISAQISYKQALRDYYKAIIDLDLVLNAGKVQ
ncbi:MAG: TolC family protein [candidate division WOR-3 bacterium]|jgi:outer membrane protein TolC